MCGFIAQLVEHRTGIVEVTDSNPIEALIISRLVLSNCLNWKIYCDDHSSYHFHKRSCSDWPFDKCDAFRVNRDQVMGPEKWFKIHTKVSNFETAFPKTI